jgi:hypothetical protein
MTSNRYPGFSKESRALIYEAEALGWTFRVTGSGHAMGKAPDGKATMSVPRGLSRADRSQQNCEADLRRWEREQTGARGKAVAVSEAMRTSAPDRILDEVMVEGAVKHLVQAAAEQATPTLVSAKPWMAKKAPRKGGGVMYESETTLERKWSDGTMDYVCAFSECGYTSPSPRSVAMHYGGTHSRTKPVTREALPTVFNPAYESSDVHFTKGYKPSERLLAALTEALRTSGATDPYGFAYAALQWVHERPDLEDVERLPREAWSAEQIVERIRALVGQPFAAQVESLERERAALVEVRERLEKEVDRLRGERGALRDLLAED